MTCNHLHVLLIRILCVLFALPSISHASGWQTPNDEVFKRQSAASGLLNDFEVYQPVLTPTGSSDQYGCTYTELLMDHSFGFSYGMPFVGSYTPPPCSFNRVTMNFTVTSAGRQFDRLGIMYLGDIEVFRTSTAEPTAGGIIWTYTKEMDQYNALWREPQKIIFDLGNLIDSTYTGAYNTTLTATFFTTPESRPTADQILPISALQSGENMGSDFQVPGQNASVSYTLPQNIQRAVISISANGQATEEFWYTNVLSSDANTFANTTGVLYGYSPFREVQLFIDGQLAGVSWPFPVVFTGGIVPGLWRPIVGIDAFDLRQHEIDVTPFLPLLCDGNSHTFEIRVAGLDDDGMGGATLSETVGSYWVITGTIFLFLDSAGSETTGSVPVVDETPPQLTIASTVTQDSSGANQTVVYTTEASRYLSISSTITTSTGSSAVSWVQRLSYANFGALTAQGLVQVTNQNTTGLDISSSGYVNSYSYPTYVNSSYSIDAAGNLGISGTITHGLDYNVFGPSVFPSGIQSFNVTTPAQFSLAGSLVAQSVQLTDNIPQFSGSQLSTTQSASAQYYSSGSVSFSFGTTEQNLSFSGVEVDLPDVTVELYTRHVLAVNSTVTQDNQTLRGLTFEPLTAVAEMIEPGSAADGFSVRSLLGRGPGKTKVELGGGTLGV
ncbi:MAG: hypothetical protein FRX48_07302 [Lasallia pustulata]|uniref:Peptide N-acetyl-beta-D-glucosaminyl asparaginase amidase A N-terminal domain-containing protein n=1 Tax=Lasallia pustulata TaxID=136370 RepID=A0A5M8PJ13_9LECA|nr:MAG: hypothetical protein FRX48_07302 [Lasallia pustulata]